jgi:hypothetical protein
LHGLANLLARIDLLAGKTGKVTQVELEELLAVPGMGVLQDLAPVFAGTLWVWLTVMLWRDGFNDLIEQLIRPRWKGTARSQALIMLPARALLLSLAAALGAVATSLGILINIAVLLNIANVAQKFF